MTNEQIAAVKRDDVIRNFSGHAWIAEHDAVVSPLDASNPWVRLARVDGLGNLWVHHLTCNSVEF